MRAPEETAGLKARAVSVATRALAHEISPILAVRELRGIFWELGVPDSDPDSLRLTGLDSETDSLPVGSVRELWDPEALRRMSDDIAKAEAWVWEFGEGVFRNVLSNWRAVEQQDAADGAGKMERRS